ncbi:MAG: hypothetical protein QXW79_04115 [Thermoplasmata archaeon]
MKSEDLIWLRNNDAFKKMMNAHRYYFNLIINEDLNEDELNICLQDLKTLKEYFFLISSFYNNKINEIKNG